MASVASERMVVAAALRPRHTQLLPKLMSLLGGTDFHDQALGHLWDCIRALAEHAADIDPAALIDHANSSGRIGTAAQALADLAADPLLEHASEQSILDAAARVKRYSHTRSLDNVFTRGKEWCEKVADTPETIISRVEDDLAELKRRSNSVATGPKRLNAIMDALLGHLDSAMAGTATLALPTTFTELDLLIDGFYDEDLIILAGRPSMGKTSALLGLAERRAKAHGRAALIFSLESKDLSLATRVLSANSGVSASDIRNGRVDERQLNDIHDGLIQINDLPIWIDDRSGLTLHEIRSTARRHVEEHGKCDIYVDYLQKVSDPKGRGERNEHVSEVSSGLKHLARELHVPVIALSQLSRALEARANKRPMMSDLRESGQIEQDADLIMFLYRDEVYNPDTKEPGIAEWIVAKQREGAVGVAKLGWASNRTKFYDIQL